MQVEAKEGIRGEKECYICMLWSVGRAGCTMLGKQGSSTVTEGRSQHQRDVTQKKSSNGIYDHVKNNEGHQIDWGKVCFLDNEKNSSGRKIKEAIYINAVVPTNLVDGRKLMNLEKGYFWFYTISFNVFFNGFKRTFDLRECQADICI